MKKTKKNKANKWERNTVAVLEAKGLSPEEARTAASVMSLMHGRNLPFIALLGSNLMGMAIASSLCVEGTIDASDMAAETNGAAQILRDVLDRRVKEVRARKRAPSQPAPQQPR
jgi:hypothetical protein